MKKITLKLIAICFLILITQSCKKDDTDYNCYYYTNMQDLPGKLDLYIDGQYKGKLPSLNVDFMNFNDTLKTKTLSLKMKSGKYDIKVTDDAGNVKVLANMHFSSRKTSSSGSAGGMGMSVKGTEMVVQLFY